MNGNVRLIYTPKGQAVDVSMCHIAPIRNEDRDFLWTFNNDEGDIGVLSTLLDPASWNVEKPLEYHVLLFNDDAKLL